MKEEPHEFYGWTAVKFLVTNSGNIVIDGITIPIGSFQLTLVPGASIAGHDANKDVILLDKLKPNDQRDFDVPFLIKWEQFKSTIADRHVTCYIVSVADFADIQQARWQYILNHGLPAPTSCS